MEPAEYLKQPYARILIRDSDGSWCGQIAEFSGCIASGDTIQEASTVLEEVAESWLMAVIAQGQDIPRPLEEAAPDWLRDLRQRSGIR